MSEEDVVGKWEMVSNVKLFDFLRAVGGTLCEDTSITFEWKKNDDGWVRFMTLKDADKGTETMTVLKFKYGVETENTLADGRKGKTLITIKDNTLTNEQSFGDDITTKTVRVFEGNKMVSTLTSSSFDGEATAEFKRID